MPAESVYEEALDAVNAAIVALSLSGLSSVVTEDQPQRTDRTLPYVSVCPAVQPETVVAATNIRDDVTYPVQIAIVASKSDTVTFRKVLGWRQSIRRRMSNQTLSASPLSGGTFRTTEVRPGPALEQNALAQHKVYLSILTVDVKTREARS